MIDRPLADPDAIISLASHEWERLPEAARLARQFPHSLVLLTMPRYITKNNCHECGMRVRRLLERGVDARRIRLLPIRVGNTREEAIAAREYARARALRRILVVTSPYHTRRAYATFRHVFASDGVIGIRPALSQSGAQPDRWWRRSYDRAYVAYEWLAVARYRFQHGIRVFDVE